MAAITRSSSTWKPRTSRWLMAITPSRSSASKVTPDLENRMQRTTPPFRADHVGSLLRPKELRDARESHKAGRVSDAELRKIEDQAIAAAVKMQEDIGLKSITDGEFRRGSWHMDFLYQVGGVKKYQEDLKIKFNNAQGGIEFTPSALRVEDKL